MSILTSKWKPKWPSSSTSVVPQSNFIPIQEEPLDLSKKSHFKGYALESRRGERKANDDNFVSEVNDALSSASSDTIVKSEINEKLKTTKYICTACFGRYGTLQDVIAHQKETHPNVECRYTQVDEEVMSTWQRKPNPLGILNVCATALPPMSGTVLSSYLIKVFPLQINSNILTRNLLNVLYFQITRNVLKNQHVPNV